MKEFKKISFGTIVMNSNSQAIINYVNSRIENNNATKIYFEKEPTNQYDVNAIKVLIAGSKGLVSFGYVISDKSFLDENECNNIDILEYLQSDNPTENIGYLTGSKSLNNMTKFTGFIKVENEKKENNLELEVENTNLKAKTNELLTEIKELKAELKQAKHLNDSYETMFLNFRKTINSIIKETAD